MTKIKLEDIKIKKTEETSNFFLEDREKDKRPKEVEEPKLKKVKPDKKVIINRYKVDKSSILSNNVPVRKSLVICLYASILLLAFFWGSNFFEQANIDLIVKRQTINYLDDSFSLSRNKDDYEIMINTEVYKETIGLSETEKVSSKSTGQIKLYNLYSTAPIKLNAGSFLKDDRGYPYVIKKDVSIPGFTSIDDIVTAGQADVSIEAFLAGEVYDGDPSLFTIDAFEGTSKFEKVYGKIEGLLSGGKEGTIYSLNEADKLVLDDIIETKVKDNLIKQVESLIPEGYLFYPKLTNFSYFLDGEISSDEPATSVEIEATLRAVLLREQNLTKDIINKSVDNLEEGEEKEIILNGIKNLNITFSDKDFKITKDVDKLNLKVTGDLEAVWQPDKEILKDKLKGIKKEDCLDVFSADRGIEKARVKIYPPWKKYIPTNKTKIKITLD
ncbi:MAG TPA: hypothetical protein PLB93_00275 [Candidatus Paceibacterota bacterium]|jgi:hypothetical protein|nr:hypothetical protein [Candidatus Paceibacterota bacterium]